MFFLKKSFFVFNFIILLIIFPSALFSNGGPVDGSSILTSGNIMFENFDNIRLESESINFIINQDFIEVEVFYHLVNEGGDQRVNYGFPIQFTDNIEYSADKGLVETEIKYFKIYDGNTELSYTTSITNNTNEYIVDYDSFNEYKVNSFYKWFLTSLFFSEGEKKTLVVNYCFKTQFDDWEFSKSFFPTFSDRYFEYILGPAGYWSDGIVNQFYYNINFRSVLNNGGKVTKIPEYGLWISDTCYVFIAEDYNIYEADPIEVQYNIEDWKKSDYCRNNYISIKNITDVRVSSTLGINDNINYSKSNLFDSDFSTAWVEGSSGLGIGEEIEIDINEFNIGYLGIINGYTKNEKIFYINYADCFKFLSKSNLWEY